MRETLTTERNDTVLGNFVLSFRLSISHSPTSQINCQDISKVSTLIAMTVTLIKHLSKFSYFYAFSTVKIYTNCVCEVCWRLNGVRLFNCTKTEKVRTKKNSKRKVLLLLLRWIAWESSLFPSSTFFVASTACIFSVNLSENQTTRYTHTHKS